MLALAGIALVTTAGFGYYRASRMSPAQRIAQVQNSPAVASEISRIFEETEDPVPILASVPESTRSGIVADLVVRDLRCEFGDVRCGLLLVDALDRVMGQQSEVHSKLRRMSGLDLPNSTSSEEWRTALLAAHGDHETGTLE